MGLPVNNCPDFSWTDVGDVCYKIPNASLIIDYLHATEYDELLANLTILNNGTEPNITFESALPAASQLSMPRSWLGTPSSRAVA